MVLRLLQEVLVMTCPHRPTEHVRLAWAANSARLNMGHWELQDQLSTWILFAVLVPAKMLPGSPFSLFVYGYWTKGDEPIVQNPAGRTTGSAFSHNMQSRNTRTASIQWKRVWWWGHYSGSACLEWWISQRQKHADYKSRCTSSN